MNIFCCGSLLPAPLLGLVLLGFPAIVPAESTRDVSFRRLALHQEGRAPADNAADEGHEIEHADEKHEGQIEEDPRVGLIIAISLNAVIFIVIISIILIVRRVHKRRAAKRTADLQLVAGALDLAFQDTGNAQLQQDLSAFPLFSIGRAHKLTNLFVADTPALKINLFDYEYTTGHGKHKRVRRQTVAALQSAELTIPAFVMRPEGKLDLVGSLLGRQDIDFDDHAAFSKAFVLKSEDESATREFFDAPLLDYFAAHGTISFETAQGVFLYFRRWQTVAASQEPLQNFLAEGYQAFQTIQERLERTS